MTTTSPARVDIAKDARDLYRAFCALDRAVQESPLDRGIDDLVRLRASQLNGCAYCVELHSQDLRKAGEDDRRIFAVAAWRESPLFSDRERAAFALTEALTQLRHDSDLDPVYEAAAEHFDPPELTALLYAIVTINGWNRLAVATHMVHEP
jgi:AhpD family alkylhydroperoxidase